MGKCLVTKLQGVIDDDSLPKIGELVILPQEGKIDVSLGFTEDTTIRTFGDAYFTDENYVQNMGTTKELTAYNNINWGDHIYVKVVNNGGLKVPIYKLRIFVNVKGIGDYNRFAFASQEKARFNLVNYETWYNTTNSNALTKVAEHFGDDKSESGYGVPYIIIGKTRFSGFGDTNKDQVLAAIDEYYNQDERTNLIEELGLTVEADAPEKVEKTKTAVVIAVVFAICVGAGVLIYTVSKSEE